MNTQTAFWNTQSIWFSRRRVDLFTLKHAVMAVLALNIALTVLVPNELILDAADTGSEFQSAPGTNTRSVKSADNGDSWGIVIDTVTDNESLTEPVGQQRSSGLLEESQD